MLALPAPRSLVVWAATALGAVLLTGCGGTSSKRASICTARAQAALARSLRVTRAAVESRATTSTQATPMCVFRVRRGAGGPIVISVSVDTTRQAYFLVMRTATEASQIFGPTRFELAPQQIDGLGLISDWFPQRQYLLATDGARFITTTVSWPAAPSAKRIAVAVAATRPYLGPNTPPPINAA